MESNLWIIVLLECVSFCVATSLKDRYIGCFRMFDNKTGGNDVIDALPLDPPTTLTIERCLAGCENTTYAGLLGGTLCVCGETFEEHLPDQECRTDCSSDTSQYCRGIDKENVNIRFYLVYSVCSVGYFGKECGKVCHCKGQVPCYRQNGYCQEGCDENWIGSTCNITNIDTQYIGCYRDESSPPAMDVKNPGGTTGNNRHWWYDNINTIEVCLNVCATFNYTYIGAQYHYDCNCGESYDRHGQSNAYCNYKCSANQSQKCGGNYANSVYSVCPLGRFGKDCLSECNCFNRTRCIYRNGTCSSGARCESGWSGESCSVRDCKTQNGGCVGRKENCTMIDLNYAIVTRCRCENGYNRNNPWEDCTDVDECSELNALSVRCRPNAYNCTNTEGGFNCSFCADGYQAVDGSCAYSYVAVGLTAVGVIIGIILVVVVIIIIIFILRHKRGNRKRKAKSQEKDFAKTIGKDLNETEAVDKKQLVYSPDADNEDCYVNLASTDESTAIKIEDLENFVQTQLATHGAFEKEFKKIPMESKVPIEEGKRKELKKKNRFKNILPYDHNRVILSKVRNRSFSDYINASHVKGFYASERLIATQGPTPDSVDDFWRMICEQNVGVIVMIANLVENKKQKCEKYWPDSGQSGIFGDIEVTTTTEKSWPDYTFRQLTAVSENSKESREMAIEQWHYTAWPDHGIPSDGRTFLAFRRKVRKSISTNVCTIVHCSAGAGRTGSFVALDHLLEQANVEGRVDVPGCVHALRMQRPQMVQTSNQYAFIYTTLLDQFTTGDTTISLKEFETIYKGLRQKDKTSGRSELVLQYQISNECKKTKSEEEENGVSLKIENNNNAFEAVYVQSYRKKGIYIVTSAPDSNTTEDFWTLFTDFGCRLAVFIDDNPEVVSFIPLNKKRPITGKSLTVSLDSAVEKDYGYLYTISILRNSESIYANVGETPERTIVTFVRLTSFVKKEAVDYGRLGSIHSAYEVIHGLEDDKVSEGPIVILSQIDDKLSGLCVAAFNAFEMMTEEDEVDIYQIVRDIRKSRNSFIPTFSMYNGLYSLVENYIKSAGSRFA